MTNWLGFCFAAASESFLPLNLILRSCSNLTTLSIWWRNLSFSCTSLNPMHVIPCCISHEQHAITIIACLPACMPACLHANKAIVET